jgi:hypothetical protein
VVEAVIHDWLELPPLPLRAPAKVSGWWDGQHSGNRGKLKNILLQIPCPPNLKGKNARLIQCALGPSHCLHEISPPKKVYHPFWPDLYPSQVQLFFIEFDWPRQKKIETMKVHKN